MALVIVESPNKIPKIKKCLGPGYQVLASVGHIMDLAKKDMGIDLDTFTPTYSVNQDKKDVVKNIKEAAKNHSDIYIATDADREGECIAYHIYDILPKKGKNIERVIFKEINKKEIDAGLKNPIGFRPDLYDAQKARRMTDRIVGFKVSPVLWSKGMKGMSAGRVQSAALNILAEREKKIRDFKPEEYWSITLLSKIGLEAALSKIGGKTFKIKTKAEVDAVVKDIPSKVEVTLYQAKSRKRSPYPPYITSTLQKDAGTKFNWTGKRVMDTAQKLFSEGLITYHRTDSTRSDPDKVKKIREEIKSKYGVKYLSPKTNQYGPKEAAQDAHEAIRPTFEKLPPGMSSDEKKLYDLIYSRFMASQMANAIFDQTTIELQGTGKKKYTFKATGSIMNFDGFLKVYGGTGNDKILPKVTKGQKLDVDKVTPNQHFTKAPPRFNGPSFTDKLEKDGVGRPSTYASIPETLISRGYVERNGKNLHVTEVGIMVSDYLKEHFESITSIEFTADMEADLDKISTGNKDMDSVMKEFHQDLKKDLDQAVKSKDLSVFKTKKECPDCKAKGTKAFLVRKVGKYGVFLGCENYPNCGYTITYDASGKEKVEHVDTAKSCPNCGTGKVIKKEGKFGDFYGCSNYPTCKWTGKVGTDGAIVEKKASTAKSTGIKCPTCKTGELVERNGKFGKFHGCNRYPKCKTIVNLDDNGNPIKKVTKSKSAAKKTGEKCPKCNSDLVERKGKFGAFVGCSGYPSCKYIKK